MIKRLARGTLALAILGPLLAICMGTASAEEGGAKIEVTVTNLTRGQIISPVVIATHTDAMNPLFVLGAAPSPELAMMAEDALAAPLIALLSGDPNVLDVQTIFGDAGPILPGESASVVVNSRGNFRDLTMVGMLVTTNDAFFALNGVRVPRRGTKVHYSPGYDAGSETNNELCAFIPGPPCGNPNVRDVTNAEGYVHIHAGIHGIGNLTSSMHDWRNPVAKITINRVH